MVLSFQGHSKRSGRAVASGPVGPVLAGPLSKPASWKWSSSLRVHEIDSTVSCPDCLDPTFTISKHQDTSPLYR